MDEIMDKQPDKKAHKKKLPDIKNPTITAAVNGLFKFALEAAAKKKVELIRKNFVNSKQQAETENASVRLWIRGYEVTDAEAAKGYTGNFAIISYAKNTEGKFALLAIKDEVELKFHPDKIRPKQRHPNWSHKVLQAAKKKRAYANLEDANKALDSLFDEFPDAAIPGINKLFIMVYEKTEDGQPPVRKYILESKPNPKGEGFIIDAQLNEKKPKPQMPAFSPSQTGAGAPEKPEIQGHFTKLVIQRRAKKKRK
jgi:hypothetical protein